MMILLVKVFVKDLGTILNLLIQNLVEVLQLVLCCHMNQIHLRSMNRR